ncbi:MAG TPA: SAM-dependent methyltransferase [Patescibacteria group bacterium]|nr:SAM-dependent methyltransferase [Patescibacteria group bacterium]
MSITERFFHERQKPEISPLAHIVEGRINAGRQISFKEYMDIALYGGIDKEGIFIPGFYSGNSVTIGDNDRQIDAGKADFITSPECSPLFGFCIAKQVLEMWELMDKPEDFTIVEMGAGNGTLAHDILYGLKYLDRGTSDSIRYLIVENSPTLIAKQRQKLKDLPVNFVQQSAVEFNHEITGVFLSNELVDALPTHIVRRCKKGWEELYIGKGGAQIFAEDWKVPEAMVLDSFDSYAPEVNIGSMIPINLNGRKWMENMAKSLRRGYIITFDYEIEDRKIPLRAFSAEDKGFKKRYHAYRDKQHLGEFDITSDVDFQPLANIGEKNGLVVLGDVTQGGFLQGTEFHKLRDELSLLNDLAITGGRGIDFMRTGRLLQKSSGMRVLIQGKDIDEDQVLLGVKNVYHDLETEKRFKPLSQGTPVLGR